MRKILLSIVLLYAAISSAIAQKLTVESFKLASSDLTAQTQPRKDLNNKNCALIKVGLGLQGVQFEGSIVGNVENKTGEYWVYIPQGNRMLNVKHANYAPIMVTFADYGIEKLESNRTYELVVTVLGDIETSQKKQTLSIRTSPTFATVLIDNKQAKNNNGVVKATLPVGKHSYVVFCEDYKSEEGIVNLKATTPSDLQITLSRNATTTIPIDNIAMGQHPIEHESLSYDNHINIPIKDGLSIDMVLVQAGTFTMGKISEMQDSWIDESPAHQVTLTNNYYIGKYEVTQQLWKAVIGDNPSHFKGDNLPVECVNWYDCQDFISKLNDITGRKFRLPTEAEWEYAARGGQKSMGYIYSGSNNLNEVAWYRDNSDNNTHPIGLKQANELGIYDMSGNVWEWCQDIYGGYGSSPQTNPTGATTGTGHVSRGGSWLNESDECRLYYHDGSDPNITSSYQGLRLVLSK